MSTHKTHTNTDTFYYITFSCINWFSLFDITNLYDYIYHCFDILKTKKAYTTGYVIMPNHLHSLLYYANHNCTINHLIGETKRFMAYEIVKRLRKSKRFDLLKILSDSVSQNEKQKKKIHNVFQPSLDIKEVVSEKFILQKLNYMHKNPISGNWNLVDNYLDYVHSSARFYELGEEGIYKIIHYSEATVIND